MKSMLITLVAIEDQEPVSDCNAEIDLATFEITDVVDQTYVLAKPEDYEDFGIEIDGKYYPVSVDYIDGGNEFMLMDSRAIAALEKFVKANPDMAYGDDDDFPTEDDDDDDDDSSGEK